MRKHLLAKSPENGGLTLEAHTLQVAQVIERLAMAWGFDARMARKGALLHDIGKAHPHFQQKIGNADRAGQKFPAGMVHRHELSSLLFLPVFPENEWPDLIDLVVAHHKSIEDKAGNKGILDLDDRDKYFRKNHVGEWAAWSPAAFDLLNKMGVPCEFYDEKRALEGLEYAIEYCWEKPLGWSRQRGLLMASDHFASAFGNETERLVRRIVEKPDLTAFAKRSHWLYPLSTMPADDDRPHTLVVAPTGAGKTDYLLRRCQGRVFYTLPYQASINAMYQRLKPGGAFIPAGTDVRVQHATSRIVESGNAEEQSLQDLPGSAIKVLTPHQLAGAIFGTPGFESILLDLAGCDIILDEVHTYADETQAMVMAIVDVLVRQGCRVHVGTATMPTALYDGILARLGGKEQVFQVNLPEETLPTYDRHRVFKLPADEALDSILEKAFADGEKVLAVFNTVKAAQAAFLDFTEKFPAVPALLLHSRFRRGDRVELEKKLTEEFNPRSKNCPCLVVSTQVVEVSLDISFDRMITQAAPIDALVQRFGRVNRVRTEETVQERLIKPVHVVEPSGRCLPYKSAIVKASYAQLPDGQILDEIGMQARIDAVYPTVDVKAIDAHLIFDADGQCKIKELTNLPKSVLLDALDIESAVCILAPDRDDYISARQEERVRLEIPISWSALRPFIGEYEHLKDIGSGPFVVPRNEGYEQLGLILEETDKFL